MNVERYKYLLSALLFWVIITLVSFRFQPPKVFVIGDSISLFYGPYLQNDLSGTFDYDRKGGSGDAFKDLDNPAGANGGDSEMVLTYLKELQANQSFKTDYFLINCGLHDIKHEVENGPAQISLKQYERNLKEIVRICGEMNSKLVWISSTPVVDSIHNSRVPFFRYNSDVIRYNQVAKSIMKKNDIPIIDLYSFTKKYIPDGYMDHVHYREDIRKKQADFIAGSLTEIYNSTKHE